MNRLTGAVVLGLCVAFAGVVWGATRVMRRDRAEAVERFAAERLRVVGEAAHEVGGRVDEVGGPLHYMADLAAARVGAAPLAGGSVEDPARELSALRAAVPQYRVVALFDANGKAQLSLGGTKVSPEAGALAPVALSPPDRAAAEAARLVLNGRAPGRIETASVSTPSGQGWSRAFAMGYRRASSGPLDGAVAVVFDLQRVLDQLHLLSSDGSRVLLLGAPGEPTAASDPVLADAIARCEDGKLPASHFNELLRRMRSGESGTLALDESDAAALGIGGMELIAAFHPVEGLTTAKWSLASLSSTAALRAHERQIVLRLAFAAAATTVLLLAFGVFLVVSGRRQVALRERLRHADEVKYLHEKTEKILDHIPTGVMAIADDGTISSLNRALGERVPASAVGSELPAAFPDAPAATVARVVALCAAARSARAVRSLLGERLALFGEEGQYSLHAVPIASQYPDTHLLLVVEDLSEVRQLEGQLVRAEKLATIGVLSAGIAHEIGTPLGVVRGRAEYILGKLGVGHPQAAGLSVIVEQIDRVSRIIRQLLDFARVRPASVRKVEVAAVVRQVVELLRFEAERRKIDLAVSALDAVPPVMADPDQLQQVLVNLVLNAIDATAAGGHVTLGAALAAPPAGEAGYRRVRIEVGDDGCGIPEELRLQIFDPFFTTKKRGQGTGLGLTIAADIVRSHGAEIEVESEPGRGTRMILLWPTEAALPGAGASHHGDPAALGPSSQGRDHVG